MRGKARFSISVAVVGVAALLGSPAAAQAWKNCVPGSIAPGGCDSIAPGGGRSIAPGGGLSIGPGGGRSIAPGGGQSIAPGGGRSIAPGGGMALDRNWGRGLHPDTLRPAPDGEPQWFTPAQPVEPEGLWGEGADEDVEEGEEW